MATATITIIAPFKGIFFGKTVVAKQEYGNNLIPLLIVTLFLIEHSDSNRVFLFEG
jgi:hypothetical protein